MSTRTTLVLLAALLGSAAVAVFVQGPGSADRPPQRPALIPGLQADEVALVRATRVAAAELLLTRAGGAWKLGAAREPADAGAVTALLARLVDAREGAVVSANPAKQDLYETDAAKGIAVRLEGAGGKLLAAFVIGRRGPDFASCYLRHEGSTEVQLVSPDLRADFARSAESWRAPPPAPPASASPAPAPKSGKPNQEGR